MYIIDIPDERFAVRHKPPSREITRYLLLVLTLSTLIISQSVSASATYRITFTGTWNTMDVTGEFPSDAHFTKLIGATHIEGEPLWRPGELATLGIENVAEFGRITELRNEIDAAITLGTAAARFSVAGIGTFSTLPGSSVKYIDVPESHPYVTAISMVAPSPDWFVGVYNTSLRSGGEWVIDLTIDLIPWDAGTEDGIEFSLSNPATDPPILIARPVDSPFVESAIIGTLRFELITGVSSGDITGDGLVNAADILLAVEIALGKLSPTTEQLLRGDVAPVMSGTSVPDGVINAADFVVINSRVLSVP